jgi:formylglycine-generating enzyme required for sulfatase activity
VVERRQPFEPELIPIPAGEFLMGSDPRTDKNAGDDEQPQHYLHLPDYSIAKTPVTNVQYLAFVQSKGQKPPKYWKGGKPPGDKEDHPVVGVSWEDAMAYCNWLAEAMGKAYRLPSEAEWEKAARGADGRIWPWGNEWDEKRCNTREGGPGDSTPVGQYSPGGDSPYGCVDMAGNVFEWCTTGRGNRTPTTFRKMNGQRNIFKEVQTGCCGAGRGTTIRTTPGVPIATGTTRTTRASATTTGFVWSPTFFVLPAMPRVGASRRGVGGRVAEAKIMARPVCPTCGQFPWEASHRDA